MKLRHSLLLLLPLCTLPALAAAAEGGCAAKAQNIQQQIDYATQHGNTHRVDGLKKALSEVQTHCTEAGLQAERQKHRRETAQGRRAPAGTERNAANRQAGQGRQEAAKAGGSAG